MKEKQLSETGCCPRFDPKPWDEKELTWNNKLFVKDKTFAFLHIPLNLEKVIGRMWNKVKKANAVSEEFLMLAYDPSPWTNEQYIAVSKEVPEMENVGISGTFLTKVFEGPYKDARKWVTEMKNYVESKGKHMEKLYFFYTTCPKCAEVYGKNYVVGFAQI